MAAFKYLSEALPLALKNIEWSQKDLAEACGLPPSQINRYCKGVNHPPIESFEKLLKALPAEQHGPVAVAYLRDCLPPDYRQVVEIHANGRGRVAESATETIIPGIDAELDEWLRKYADLAMRHTEVRAMLRSYLEAIRLVPSAAAQGSASGNPGNPPGR